MTITHYIILQNSSSLRNDHLKNCKRQSTVGVSWLPQCHLPGQFWNIHITCNSFQWHDGTDDKDDFSSSILHPRVRFLIQQRDKYFCAGLIHKVDSVLWIFTKFEAPKLGKTFQRRNSVPSLSQVSTLAKISCPVVCPPFWYNTQNVYFLWFNNWW